MIKPIKEEELFESLEIFHRGYETVAAEFGLTEENCPDRGRASLPYHKLLSEFESGTLMYGYFDGDKLTGFFWYEDFGRQLQIRRHHNIAGI